MPPTLDIVIVNWNTGPLLRDCLASIAAARTEGFVLRRVTVVDNASGDGSADDLDGMALPLTVVRNAGNRGFAAACNQGAAGSTADHLLFLNPDTRLFPDSLAVPLAVLERPEQARTGLLGIQLVEPGGAVARCCARFPTPARLAAQSLGLDRLLPRLFPPHFMTEWDHRSTRAVDQVMGAFLLVRRCLFEQLGGFDERFFVYFEDVDLALRARRQGWRSLFLAEARAMHVGGGSSRQVKATRLFYLQRSRILFCFKHFGLAGASLATAATLLAEPPARLARALARRDRTEAGEVLAACRMLWADLAHLLPKARHGRVDRRPAA